MKVVDYQNLASFITCSGVTFNLYWYYHDPSTLYYMTPFIVSHFFIDFFVATTDVKIHHLFIFMNYLYKYLNPTNPLIDNLTLILYKTEISTFFYVFRYYLKSEYVPQWICSCNDILFLLTFMKFRIYDYFQHIILNQQFYPMHMPFLFYIGSHGMFLLNVYWFLFMIKIKCKKIRNIKYKQYIDSIDLFIPLYVVSYIYSYKPQPLNFLDMMGLFLLSVGSYLYYTFPKPEEIPFYQLIYIGTIHLRYILCMGTHFYSFTMDSLFTIYNSFITSIRFHFWTYTFTIAYKLKYLSTPKDNLPYLLTCIPCIWDMGVICINSHYVPTSIIPLYISILIPMMIQIKPFYEWNSVAIHMLIIIQSGFLVFCNIHKFR